MLVSWDYLCRTLSGRSWQQSLPTGASRHLSWTLTRSPARYTAGRSEDRLRLHRARTHLESGLLRPPAVRGHLGSQAGAPGTSDLRPSQTPIAFLSFHGIPDLDLALSPRTLKIKSTFAKQKGHVTNSPEPHMLCSWLRKTRTVPRRVPLFCRFTMTLVWWAADTGLSWGADPKPCARLHCEVAPIKDQHRKDSHSHGRWAPGQKSK